MRRIVIACVLPLSSVAGMASPAAAVGGPSLQQESIADLGVNPSLLATPAKLNVREVTLAEALTALRHQSKVDIAFSPTFLPERYRVNCDCLGATVEQALVRILKGTGLSYFEMPLQIVIEPDQLAKNINERTRESDLDTRTDMRPDIDGSDFQLRVARQGTVTGRVLNEQGQPIAEAQVRIAGLELETVTRSNGTYILTDVPFGTHTVVVERLGYHTQSRTVPVREDESVEVNFELREHALALDEIIVTGTAGGVRRRALGNAVSTVDATAIAEASAPPTDLARLINARVPSLLFQPYSGSVGMGGRLRLRGGSSLLLQNEPIIYVDGVRIDNRRNTGPGTGRDPGSPGIYPSISRMNDLNVESIDRIEIIKGPAAATLYGTEAANGVIQIFTKSGTPGPARWSMNITSGVNWISNPEGRWRQVYRRRDDGSVYSFNLVETENARGTSIFRTAPLQRYALSLGGGAEAIQYHAGLSWNDDQGVLAPNRQGRFSTDVNVRSQVSNTLNLSTNMAYVTGKTALAAENVTGGLSTIGSLNIPFRNVDPETDPIRGFNVAPPEAWGVFDFNANLDRYTVSIRADHTPLSWLNHRVTVGRDAVYEENTTENQPLSPETAVYWPVVAGGRRHLYEVNSMFTTVDYRATATARPTEMWSAVTSVGGQFYRKELSTRTLDGRDFPAVGLGVVGAAALREVDETYLTNTTLGLFVEEQVGWKDRLFLTAGLRVDDNSAFGRDFSFVSYPKVSASWIVSEESFFRSVPLINTLKLRAAFGTSGQQPDAFAAIRTYEPITGPGDSPAVLPNAPGNPSLGPERGKEFEAGLEAVVLDDRLSVEFNYYRTDTEDLIVNRPQARSNGFPGEQFVNLGKVTNSGIEASGNIDLITTSGLSWNVGINFSTNSNRIVDLGGLPPVSAGANQAHVAGFPIAAFFGRKTVSAEVVDGEVINVMCDAGGGEDYTQPSGLAVPCADAPDVYLGKPQPSAEGAFSTGITLFNRLTLSGLLDFKVGQTAFDNAGYMVCLSLQACEVNFYPELDPVRAGSYTLPSEWGSITPPNRNFAKLREVSLAFDVPEHLLQFGLTSARVILTGRELYTWKGDYEGVDPELVTATGGWYYQVFHQVPPATSVLASLRITF